MQITTVLHDISHNAASPILIFCFFMGNAATQYGNEHMKTIKKDNACILGFFKLKYAQIFIVPFKGPLSRIQPA